jgi:hypothetical protein
MPPLLGIEFQYIKHETSPHTNMTQNPQRRLLKDRFLAFFLKGSKNPPLINIKEKTKNKIAHPPIPNAKNPRPSKISPPNK